MKRRALVLLLTLASLLGLALAARRTLDNSRRVANAIDSTGAVTLPNGWRITPVGKHIKLPGDLPMKMAMTGDGSQLLVLTGGFHNHSLSVIDVRNAAQVATLDVVKTRDGVAFDPSSGTVYLSGGGHAKSGFAEAIARLGLPGVMQDSIEKPILRVHYSGGKLTPELALSIAGLDEKDRYISGIALGPDGSLYALNIQTDTCTG